MSSADMTGSGLAGMLGDTMESARVEEVTAKTYQPMADAGLHGARQAEVTAKTYQPMAEPGLPYTSLRGDSNYAPEHFPLGQASARELPPVPNEADVQAGAPYTGVSTVRPYVKY